METLLTTLHELEVSDRVPTQYLPSDDELVIKIEQLADQELILDGQCHWDNIRQIEAAGYRVRALSSDSFGWLMGGIYTNKGIVRYG